MLDSSGTIAPPLLAVEQLHIVASGKLQRTLVDGISFTLNAGEMLGLIGESGAGKSTIGQAILGHQREGMVVTGGRILFAGQDLLRSSEAQLRRIRGKRIAYLPARRSASASKWSKLLRCTD